MCFSGLMVNPRKSNALIIGKLSQLQFNCTTINIVHNVKNLGIIFNNSLNWSNHTNAICGKTVAMLRSLSLAQYFTLFNIRMLLAKTYLIPNLMYGFEQFSSSDSVSRNKLKVTYNSITRYVCGRRRYSRISEFPYYKIYNTSFEN